VDKGARPSGSPTYPLDVFAALSADRKKLVISVVNPTETTEDCELNLIGIQSSGKARLWQLTAPAGAAEAQPTQGPFMPGPKATMAESTLPQVPSKLTVPASSISVYEFDVKQ
jgi:alpha-N-arabinofuranosidase